MLDEVESELHEAGEEMRKLTVGRRKADAEGLRVSDTSKAVFGGRRVFGPQSSEGEAGLARVRGSIVERKSETEVLRGCEESRQTRRSISRTGKS